ncbi:putative hydrolase of the HAD superfamily [Tumebacillus sp. BK434]|uniref:HAD family hydrolase n=1 Tax=Tumebacillus sp. BK434 TaxID=2512169 RepID=UPI0010470B99|nr:HAD family hydrolase [Tumebacillus sp. BK434]TCP53341.1 putative hydrolase of the HAD superfamily [Tumebacillus sp. BK434]
MKAVFFDLDGTLGAHGLGSGAFLLQAQEELRSKFPELSFGEPKDFLMSYRSLNNHSWGAWVKKELVLPVDGVKVHIWREQLKKFGVPAELADGLAAELKAAMLAAHPDDWRPAPGVHEVLQWAKEQGAKLLVLSNGAAEVQLPKLEAHGLLSYFDHLVFSQSIGYSKPDPLYFEHALELAGCKAEEALMIGDSYTHDIEPADFLGMRRVWIFEDAPILGLPDRHSAAELRAVPGLLASLLT